MRPTRWFEAIEQCHKNGQAYVLITVLSTAGSTPRNTGSKMVVSDSSCYDTIGGGHLEFSAIDKAKSLLAKNSNLQHIEHYPLSSKLGQCCGGATHVLFEVVNSHVNTLAVFGAGHVAQALMSIVEQLPLQIVWVDNRENVFPSTISDKINQIEIDEPAYYVDNLPENAMVVVMTHNHQLDFAIVEKALKRNDLSYVGMIGSKTKAKRFRAKLAHKQIAESAIDKLVSPIGILDVPGKQPIEIAISIAGQLVQHLHRMTPDEKNNNEELQWRNTKQILSTL